MNQEYGKILEGKKKIGGLIGNEEFFVYSEDGFAYVATIAELVASALDEQDPIFLASPAYNITNTNISNWNEAYSWGDHSLVGYLTSFTETDPIFSASPSFNITNAHITNWNTAYSWGDHAGLYALLVHTHIEADITDLDKYTQLEIDNFFEGTIVGKKTVHWDRVTNKPLTFTPSSHTHVEADITDLDKYTQSQVDTLLSGKSDVGHIHDDRYFTETELSTSGQATVHWDNITNVNETDPIFLASPAGSITLTDITNWNTAFGWGDHAGLYSLVSHNHTHDSLDVINLATSGVIYGHISDASQTIYGTKSFNDVLTLLNALQFNIALANPAYQEGLMFYDQVNSAFAGYTDVDGFEAVFGEKAWTHVVNITGSTLFKGQAVYINVVAGVPTVELAVASNKSQSIKTLGILATDVLNGEVGIIVRYGIVSGFDTSSFNVNDALYLDPATPGGLTNAIPVAPDYPVRVCLVVASDVSDGAVGVDTIAFNGSDTSVNIEGTLNGIVLNKPSVDVFVDTGVIYFETDNEDTPTKNLPFIYDGVTYFLNTTTGSGTGGKARVALTAGTTTVPQDNYIYIVESGGVGVLTANTTGFPAGSSPIGVASLKDVTSTDTYGCLAFRRWNNTPNNGAGDGFNQYISKRLRLEGSKWFSGVTPTVSIITNGGAIDNLNVSTASGIVYQLHEQTFSAKDGTEYYVVNHPTTPFLRITDLNQIDVDANGNTLRNNNTRYGLNILGGQNSAGIIDRLYVLLPNGNYSSDSNAINDVNNYAITTVPASISPTSFRICRIVVNYDTSASGTFTNLLGAGGYQDERGFPLGIGGGGSGSGASQTSFSDANFEVFNNIDATKILQLSLSGITTGTTRILSIPDVSAEILVNTGNQTIGGVKTFTSFPVTPNSAPTTDYQVANKKYVDDNSGGISEYDATIGATGADYTTVNAAYAAGKYNLVAIDTVTLSADLTIDTASLRINLNGQTLNATTYGFITDASGYRVDIYGYGIINFAYASAKEFIDDFSVSVNKSSIKGDSPNSIVINNTSTVADCTVGDKSVFSNLKLNAPNVASCGFGRTGSAFVGLITDIEIVGGGSSCNYVVKDLDIGGKTAKIENLLLSGTFASTFVIYHFLGTFENINYISTSTSTMIVGYLDNLKDNAGRLTVRVYSSTSYPNGYMINSVCGAVQLYEDSRVKDCRFKNAVTLSVSVGNANLKAIKCIFESTLQLGTSVVPLTGANIYLERNIVIGASTLSLSDANFNKNIFSGAVTLESGAANNKFTDNIFSTSFTDNSGVTTNLFWGNSGFDDITQNLLKFTGYTGSVPRLMELAADGTVSAIEAVVGAKITDATTITNITTPGNWTGTVYTGPALSGVDEGMIYQDSTYKYEAYSDNFISRFALA